MIDLTQNFSTSLVTGTYPVIITAAEVKQTKAGTGSYLAVTLKDQSGKTGTINFNVKNPNQIAVNIGLAGIKFICLATKMALNFSSEFELASAMVGKSFLASIVSEQDGDFQRIKIKRCEELVGQFALQAPAQQMQPNPKPQQFQQSQGMNITVDDVPF